VATESSLYPTVDLTVYNGPMSSGGTTTVRISERGHRRLRALASSAGLPLQTVLEEAIDLYRRERFARELDDGYAAIWADPRAAEEETAERALWDATLADGLADL
jgi:predicted DNA-binding protein